MKIYKYWNIWGINLPALYIMAEDFDTAIAEARKINKNYNTGQLSTIYKKDCIDSWNIINVQKWLEKKEVWVNDNRH